MSYFNRLPNVEYDQKPLTFPYSETEYVLVKNFFKRYKLSESSYNYNTLFTKYAVTDIDRLDSLSYKFYKTSEYDWVIAITNNILNVYWNLPRNDSELYETVNKAYIDSPGNQSLPPSERIHHYETKEVKDSVGRVVLKAGLKVESTFSNSNTTPSDGKFYYYDSGLSIVVKVSGSSVIRPVTNYEYEIAENEKRREIYILKPQFIQEFIAQFEEGMKYSKSSSYVNKNTKKSGI